MLEKVVIVDARDHLLGRLCSVVAKELLAGQKVLIVRCEQACISGSLVRNKVKYAQFRKKRMNTNPGRGPYHLRSPARIVWRTIRGMVNQKSQRGQDALSRLSCFEGIPHPYDKKKRQVIPAALRVLRLKPGRNYCVLADLSDSVGWKHKELVERLEEKRKVKAEAFYQKKLAKAALNQKALDASSGDLAKVNEVLTGAGY